ERDDEKKDQHRAGGEQRPIARRGERENASHARFPSLSDRLTAKNVNRFQGFRRPFWARNSRATSSGRRLSRSTAAFNLRIAATSSVPPSASSACRTPFRSRHSLPRTTNAASYGGKKHRSSSSRTAPSASMRPSVELPAMRSTLRLSSAA